MGKNVSAAPSTAPSAFEDLYEKDDKGMILYESIMAENFPENFPAPISIVGMCVSKLDQMNAFSKLIVKCAAM